jgi:hypothetical protein
MDSKILVAPARYITVTLAAVVTGYTESAIYNKISKGDWVENKEWRRGPDGKPLVDLQGYERWVERQSRAA